MEFKTNSQGLKYCYLTDKLVFHKRPNKERRFFFMEAPGLNKLYGLKNIRFKININKNWCNHWNIELPFFKWVGDNSGWTIGTQKHQLVSHKCRIPKRK